MDKIKVLTVFGTRPEAIKMAPLVKEFEKRPEFDSLVCVSAQHREMLDQVLSLFEIAPDFDLNIMKENQNLWELTSSILLEMKTVFEKAKPDIVLVHGDTTTALAASLSAFYAKIPVGHVEAGLRTFNKYYPFPEEINRVLADAVSSLHFAPTDKSVQNLLNSGISKDTIHKTGNTVIDALLYTVKDITPPPSKYKKILVTAHRRENHGAPLEEICEAILEIVSKNPDVEVTFPVHLNPNVRKIVCEKLQNSPRINLIDPLDYKPFALEMKSAHIILTDSGGVQEEAPSLGVPVLVLRDETERPEAVEYGTVKLVGPHREKIVQTVQKLLDDKAFHASMSNAANPYGDGTASVKIADIILKYFKP